MLSDPPWRDRFLYAAVAGLVAIGPRDRVPEEPVLDPLPIRRVLIPAERLRDELERVRQGVLIQLSRQEFDARVAAAVRAGAAAENSPWLAESRYRATLEDTSLSGSGQWTIVNPGPGTAVMPVPPLSLALRQIRVDEINAVFGDVDGEGSVFWWSALASSSYLLTGRRAETSVPGAPISIFAFRPALSFR